MAIRAQAHAFCFSPDQLASAIRETIWNGSAIGRLDRPGVACSIGSFDVYRSVTLDVYGQYDNPETGWEIGRTVLVLAFVASGDALPGALLSASPLWNGSFSLFVGQEPNVDVTADYSEITSQVIAVKRQVMEELCGCAFRGEVENMSSLYSDSAYQTCNISMFDDIGFNLAIVERSSLVFSRSVFNPPVLYPYGSIPAVAGGSFASSGIVNLQPLTASIDRLASRGFTASFDDGKHIVDLGTGDIITVPEP